MKIRHRLRAALAALVAFADTPARRLGAYGRETDKTDDGRIFVEFSAEAGGLLMPGNRYRVVDLRAGKFKE
jgi:hypothetical protein